MPFTRDRPRVPGSWRDRQQGDCFTTRGGAVVCEGRVLENLMLNLIL